MILVKTVCETTVSKHKGRSKVIFQMIPNCIITKSFQSENVANIRVLYQFDNAAKLELGIVDIINDFFFFAIGTN